MPDHIDPCPLPADVDIADILAAMRQEGGYLDISPDDALELYHLAYAHALARLRQGRPVRDLMTSPVVTADPDQSAREVVDCLARARVSGVPVVDDGVVVGVVSIKDVLRALGLPGDASPMALVADLLAGCPPSCRDVQNLRARDLMSAPALTIAPDTPVAEAADLMAAKNVNRLPVVAASRLVGIVTRGDIVRSWRLSAQGGRP